MRANQVTFDDNLMPFDTDTEQAVLATLMRYNEKYEQYSDILSSSMFYYKKEKAIFACIQGVINGGGITDVNSLYNYARANEVGYLLDRVDFLNILQMSNAKTLEQDIHRLDDMGRRRECWLMLQQSAQRVLDLTLELGTELSDTTSAIGSVQDGIGRENVADLRAAFGDVRKMVNENQQNRGTFLRCGFQLFDEKFVLRPGTLTVIAAFTSVGKSALAMNIAVNVAQQGIAVAYYSLEMGKAELAARMISKDMGLSAGNIMNKKLTDEQVTAFETAVGMKQELPIYFDDRSTVDFNKTVRSIRTMVKSKGVKLVIVDYLQIYAQVKDDAEESISYMARTAKNVAKEMEIPVIALSQLNRSALHPSLKMLRGSGQIEESADNVVLIDRPEAYPDNKVTKYEGDFANSSIKDTAKLILAKGRGVGTWSTLVGFEAQYTRFFDFYQAKAGEYQEQSDALPF